MDGQTPSRRMAEGVPVEIAWFGKRSTGTGPGWRGRRVEALTRRGGASDADETDVDSRLLGLAMARGDGGERGGRAGFK